MLAANPKLRRFRSAGDEALSAVSGAPSLDVLARAMNDFLSAKLDLPAGAIDGDRVASELSATGYGSGLGDDVRNFFADIEKQRYAPSGDGDDLRRELSTRAKGIVEAVESRKDLLDKLARALALGLVLSVACVGTAGAPLASMAAAADVVSESGPDDSFFAGNHAYAEGRYAEAAAKYEEVVDQGLESGALHFNLGNTNFKLGDEAGALASYLRARRLRPNDPDVMANLAFAKESLELADGSDSLWRRVLFFLAYRVTEAGLAKAFTLAWWCLWAALALGLMWPGAGRLSSRVSWLAGFSSLLFVVNLLYRATALELWNEAVVSAENGAVVRFEPQSDGTEHFAAPAGTRLEIEAEEQGWIRVTRDDGRKGWLQEGAVSRLR